MNSSTDPSKEENRCPNCHGIHWGSSQCPYTAEMWRGSAAPPNIASASTAGASRPVEATIDSLSELLCDEDLSEAIDAEMSRPVEAGPTDTQMLDWLIDEKLLDCMIEDDDDAPQLRGVAHAKAVRDGVRTAMIMEAAVVAPPADTAHAPYANICRDCGGSTVGGPHVCGPGAY